MEIVGQLSDLQDKLHMQRVGSAVTEAVALSFADPEVGGTQTQDEIKHRTNICLEFYKIMRNDLRWSITKICDQLPRLLVAELTGVGVEFLDQMHKRGWVKTERRTAGGLVLPS